MDQSPEKYTITSDADGYLFNVKDMTTGKIQHPTDFNFYIRSDDKELLRIEKDGSVHVDEAHIDEAVQIFISTLQNAVRFTAAQSIFGQAAADALVKELNDARARITALEAQLEAKSQ